MAFLNELWYMIIVLLHIITVLVGVGTVTVIDYLHLVGLKSRRLERKLTSIYPILSRLIFAALAGIFATGSVLVANNPGLLKSPLFQLKLILIGVILLNAFALHKRVWPALDKCIKKGLKLCPPKVLREAAFCGSLSIVSWYAVLILSLSKTYGYTVMQFIVGYLIALAAVFLFSLFIEKKLRH